MVRSRLALAAFAVALITLLGLSACGNPPEPQERLLFLAAPARPYVSGRGARLVRYVKLNPEVMSQLTLGRYPAPFMVNLSNTEVIQATTVSNTDADLDFRQWKVSLEDTGNLRMMFRPDLSGEMRIETQGRIFQVALTQTPGIYALSIIDQAAFPEGTDFLLAPGSGPAPNFTAMARCDAPLPFPIPVKPAATLNVLILVTPNAAAANTGLDAAITLAVERIQEAMQTPNFYVRVTLEGIEPWNITEAASMETDLRRMTSSPDIANRRNNHRADLISLVGIYNNACGIGWLNEGMHAGQAPYGFSVVAANCLPNETLAHEIGHNLGMRHDAETDGRGGSNHGYIIHARRVRTILAYDNPCSRRGYFCRRLNSYSSPQYLYGKGELMGDGRSDNLEVLCRSAPIVEKFR